jgi:regulation of enolase protein 1 (concanavalin A-like superfamily)
MRKLLIFFIAFVLVACSSKPSQGDVETAIAKTLEAKPTEYAKQAEATRQAIAPTQTVVKQNTDATATAQTLAATVTALAMLSNPQASPGFSDDFGSDRLQTGWMWEDPLGDSRYNFTDIPGSLRFIVPGFNHDFWGSDGFEAPRILQNIRGGFIAQTEVTINPARFYQGAGILVQQDSMNWVRLEIGNLLGDKGAYLFYKNNAPELLANSIGLNFEIISLRLEHCDNSITGYASVDNQNWQQIATVPFQADTVFKIGLMVTSSRQSSELVADFAYFTLKFCP